MSYLLNKLEILLSNIEDDELLFLEDNDVRFFYKRSFDIRPIEVKVISSQATTSNIISLETIKYGAQFCVESAEIWIKTKKNFKQAKNIK